jgi:hypothetical protein
VEKKKKWSALQFEHTKWQLKLRLWNISKLLQVYLSCLWNISKLLHMSSMEHLKTFTNAVGRVEHEIITLLHFYKVVIHSDAIQISIKFAHKHITLSYNIVMFHIICINTCSIVSAHVQVKWYMIFRHLYFNMCKLNRSFNCHLVCSNCKADHFFFFSTFYTFMELICYS